MNVPPVEPFDLTQSPKSAERQKPLLDLTLKILPPSASSPLKRTESVFPIDIYESSQTTKEHANAFDLYSGVVSSDDGGYPVGEDEMTGVDAVVDPIDWLSETSKAITMVKEKMTERNVDHFVYGKIGANVSSNALNCLDAGRWSSNEQDRWLDDEMINAYISIRMEEFEDTFLIAPSIIQHSLSILQNPKAGRPSLGLHQGDKFTRIVIPVNLSQLHWVICVVQVDYEARKGIIHAFNSMQSFDQMTKTAMMNIRRILARKGESRDSPLAMIEREIEHMQVLEQLNTYDCGIIIMANALAWLENDYTPHVVNGQEWRQKVAIQLLRSIPDPSHSSTIRPISTTRTASDIRLSVHSASTLDVNEVRDDACSNPVGSALSRSKSRSDSSCSTSSTSVSSASVLSGSVSSLLTYGPTWKKGKKWSLKEKDVLKRYLASHNGVFCADEERVKKGGRNIQVRCQHRGIGACAAMARQVRKPRLMLEDGADRAEDSKESRKKGRINIVIITDVKDLNSIQL